MSNMPKVRRRRMKRRAAVVAAGLMSVATVAGASVLIQNFMAVDFDAGTPPCLIKTIGDDANDPADPNDFEGFDFTLGTTSVDNVDLTEEKISINGLTGDRVVAEEVYVIENNCDSPLDVTLVNGVQTDAFTQKHLEVWLGTVTTAGYPGTTNATWDQAPLVFDPGGIINATSGTVTIPAGGSVPVGMIASTGAAATGTDSATWTVQAVAP